MCARGSASYLALAGSYLARSHREIDAPTVGVTSVEHLEDAVETVDLDGSDIEHLEEPYEPVGIEGHE